MNKCVRINPKFDIIGLYGRVVQFFVSVFWFKVNIGCAFKNLYCKIHCSDHLDRALTSW